MLFAVHQANGDNETWTGLAPVLRQAAIISGDTKYEDAIKLLPWAKDDWPGEINLTAQQIVNNSLLPCLQSD